MCFRKLKKNNFPEVNQSQEILTTFIAFLIQEMIIVWMDCDLAQWELLDVNDVLISSPAL